MRQLCQSRFGHCYLVVRRIGSNETLEGTMQPQESTAESGMELHDLLLDREFRMRLLSSRDAHRETIALHTLAKVFADEPETILQELVNFAVEYCGADAAGISLEEADANGDLRFRWVAVAGSFAQYVNGTTPRFFSPCGTCLSAGRAQFFRVSQPYYDFLGVTAEPIVDGMLIPWVSQQMRGTVWVVSHTSPQRFDINDYELLKSLAD